MESTNAESTTTWQPNEELLEMLINMGISKIAAEHVSIILHYEIKFIDTLLKTYCN